MSMLCWVEPSDAIRSRRKYGIMCSECQSICWVRKPDLRKEKNKTLTGYDHLCNYLDIICKLNQVTSCSLRVHLLSTLSGLLRAEACEAAANMMSGSFVHWHCQGKEKRRWRKREHVVTHPSLARVSYALDRHYFHFIGEGMRHRKVE